MKDKIKDIIILLIFLSVVSISSYLIYSQSIKFTDHKINDVIEVSFRCPTEFLVYSLNPDTKEYRIDKVSGYKPRIFIDHVNEPNSSQVFWKRNFWTDYDEEIHIADMRQIRGSFTD